MQDFSGPNTDEWDELLLLDDTGFKIAEVVSELLKRESVRAKLLEKWTELARKLKVDIDKRKKMADLHCAGTIKIDTVVEDILLEWKAKTSKHATIKNLISAVRELEMNQMADILEDIKAKRIMQLEETKQKSLRLKRESTTVIKRRTPEESPMLSQASDAVPAESVIFSTRRKSRCEVESGPINLNKPINNFTIFVLCVIVILAFIMVVAIVFVLAYLIIAYPYFSQLNVKSLNDKLNYLPVDAKSDSTDILEIVKKEDKEMVSLSVSSLKEYETKMFSMDTRFVHLNISLNDLYNWNMKSEFSKVNFVRSVHLSGVFNREFLINFLKQTIYLSILQISNQENSFCETVDEEETRIFSSFKGIDFRNLETFVLLDFSICTPFYKFIRNNFRFKKLSLLKIVNSIFTDDNMVYIRNIIYSSSNSLRHLEINGKSNSTQQILDSENPIPTIKSLKVDIETLIRVPYTHQQLSIFHNDFCKALPNLEIFENTIGMSYSDVLVVLSCSRLKTFTATVIFQEQDTFWNINSSIGPKQLRSVTLVLYFLRKCPSSKEWNQLGLHDIKQGIKTKISLKNCSIYTDTSTSNFINFVEEYNSKG